MSQQWIWMGLAAGTLALGTASAQVDPNSAGAITTGQPNPGAPPGTPAPNAPAGTPIGNPYTEPLGDPNGAANPGIGGSGTGAVIPQPYSPQPSVPGATPDILPSSPGTSTPVTGSGAVIPPSTSPTVTGTGAVLAPGTSTTVAGSTGSTATTGALMPPATTTPGTTLPGASNSTVTPGTPTGTTSSMGVVLPPATGTTAPGAAGTTLSPDSNTSSNSVTPLNGGNVTNGTVGP
ncbi:hypothetical protein [Corallococcus aberystwythensis]|nr:hypothetical protein [Corallococcus aberystwythensis]